MANNRLYILDPETNESFMLAKALGDGWYIHNPEDFAQRLEQWLDGRDMAASYGGINVQTELRLCTELDLPDPDVVLQPNINKGA